jgi:hypothetical protein
MGMGGNGAKGKAPLLNLTFHAMIPKYARASADPAMQGLMARRHLLLTSLLVT